MSIITSTCYISGTVQPTDHNGAVACEAILDTLPSADTSSPESHRRSVFIIGANIICPLFGSTWCHHYSVIQWHDLNVSSGLNHCSFAIFIVCIIRRPKKMVRCYRCEYGACLGGRTSSTGAPLLQECVARKFVSFWSFVCLIFGSKIFFLFSVSFLRVVRR